MISPFFLWQRSNKKATKPTIPDISQKTRPVEQQKPVQNISKPLQSPSHSSNTTSFMITTEQIKNLRDQTGISVMQCKKALEEAGGDMDKSMVILRKKSGELSAKKADRTFRSGTIQAYVHANGNVATIVELNCETDFVSGNEEFKTLARDIAMHITASNPKFLKKEDITEADMNTARSVFAEEVKNKPVAMQDKILQGKLDTYFAEMVLLNQPFIKNPEVTIQGLIDAAVQKFGEKTAIARFKRFKVLEN